MRGDEGVLRTTQPDLNIPPDIPRQKGGHRGALTTGLILTVSMSAFEQLAVATVLPVAVDDIGGLSLYGWAFSGFMLAQIVGIAVAGRAADRQGLAAPFALGIALFALGLAGAGAAPSMPALIAARLLQGIGAGFVQVLAYAAVARGYPVEARPRLLALLSTAWVAPGLVGPALAAAIAGTIGWRWVFLSIIPLCGVAALLTLPALRPLAATPDVGTSPPRQVLPAAALALAVGLAVAALSRTELAVAIGGGAVAAAAALPSLRRLLPAGTLSAAPGAPAAVATVGLLSAAIFGTEVFLPLTLTELRAQPLTLAGLVLTASTIAWTAGAWLQERIVNRFSRRTVASAGLVLLTIGIATTMAILSPRVPPAVAVLTWGLACFGTGLAYSTASLVVLESASSGAEGEASTGLQLAFVLGTALGTGVGGAVLAQLTADGELTASVIATVDLLAVGAGLGALAVAQRLPRRIIDSPIR
jgi:MFS family permease